ncbi:MAG TPA: NADH-quinone oxidoreductase subunit NuoE [Tissierellaceae bacterium]
MGFKLDMEKNKEKIKEFMDFIDDNRNKPGILMPVLQEAQEKFGYLPEEILELISKELKIPLAEIYGVATFYSQFTFVPKGENNISVCLGTACYVKGAEKILEELENILDIKSGETTSDLKFSITPTRCLGACRQAPVINVKDETYGKLKPEDIKEIIEKYDKEVLQDDNIR